MSQRSMFQPFAANYYVGTVNVDVHRGEYPQIREEQLERVNRELHDDDASIVPLDRPLVFKVDNHYLTVTGREGIPDETLLIPEDIVRDLRNTNPPEEKQVLLAAPDANLSFLYGGHQQMSDR